MSKELKQKMIRNSLIGVGTLAVIFFAVSCCGTGKKADACKAEQACEQQATTMQIDNLLQDADTLSGKTVTIEGICTHICAHGARKIFLMGSDDTKMIRIEANKDMDRFDAKCVNSIVTVTGELQETRIDEAYLQKWEARIAATTEEKHGESEAGCSTEKKARGEVANTPAKRIADFRTKIAERQAKEGKAYLSFYYVLAHDYSIAK